MLAKYLKFSLLLSSLPICHCWRWADVYVRGADAFQGLDRKLEFLMDNYDIISLEKCLHETDEDTEEMFLNLTSQMRQLRPGSDNKILFYWHLTQTYDCYEASDDLLSRPDLWLYDTQGYPVIISNSVHWDFRIPDARDLWSDGDNNIHLTSLYPKILVGAVVISRSEGQANGVFVDGTHELLIKDCGFSTCGVDGKSCCEFSEEDQEDFTQGLVAAVGELQRKIHHLDSDNLVIGNGLQNYEFNAGDGNPRFDLFVDVVDGFSMEHMMAFEGAIKSATDFPFIRIDALRNSMQLRNKLVQLKKYLLVRSFPGPVGQPIVNVDGFSVASLPPHYPYPDPTNNQEAKQAMMDLYKFPLAVFLCGFAQERIFYTYSYWYNIDQSVPCTSCQFPDQFPGYLDLEPGSALTQPTWEGDVCTREFENVEVRVNIRNQEAEIILP